MPLSPEEKAEMDKLEREVGQSAPAQSPSFVSQAGSSLYNYLKGVIPQNIDRQGAFMREGVNLGDQRYPSMTGKMGPDAPASVPSSPDELEHSQSVLASVGGAQLGQGEQALLGPEAKPAVDSLKEIPGKLMNRAVGLDEASPEIGQRLINQGVGGTRGMMEGQVERGLAKEGPQLRSAISQIKGPVDASSMGEAVLSDVTPKYQTSSGIAKPGLERELGRVENIASKYADIGQVPANDLYELKQGAGSLGYKPSGTLDPKTMGSIGRSADSAARSELTNAFARENPGMPNAVDEGFKRVEPLMKASKSLPNAGMRGLSLYDFLKGNFGKIANEATRAPMLSSGAAHAANLGIKAAPAAGLAAKSLAPLDVQGKVGLTPDEEAELRQLEAELGQR